MIYRTCHGDFYFITLADLNSVTCHDENTPCSFWFILSGTKEIKREGFLREILVHNLFL